MRGVRGRYPDLFFTICAAITSAAFSTSAALTSSAITSAVFSTSAALTSSAITSAVSTLNSGLLPDYESDVSYGSEFER